MTTLIILGGWLGFMTVIYPVYSSPLWPPAGLSLAALLIWGRSALPAVLLGAFANNLLVAGQMVGDLRSEFVVAAFLIGTASALQALVAAQLSQKYLGPGVPALDGPRGILLFFLLTGPVANLVAASLGVLCLWGFSMTPTHLLGASWLHWWIGDSLGVFIISPLMFCQFAQPRKLWAARRQWVGLPLSITLLALTSIFVFVQRAEHDRIQMDFDGQARMISRQLIEYGENAVDNSLALRDLYMAAGSVNRRQFARFSRSLLTRHPELQALEWLPRVALTELADFERQIQNEGFADFRVVERDADDKLIPVKRRAEYFPIAYVEPMRGNEPAFGLDSAATAISRASKQQALASGRPSVSQTLTLIQRRDAEASVLLSIPVFAVDGLKGFVSAVVLPRRLVETALAGLDLEDFAVTISDVAAAEGHSLLYRKDVAHPVSAYSNIRPWQQDFLFADRVWRIGILPDSGFLDRRGSWLPWFTLLSGMGLTSLFSILLLTISGRAAQIQTLVDRRTLDLQTTNAELQAAERQVRESEAYLRTILNSVPECIMLMTRDGELLNINPAGLSILGADSLGQIQALKPVNLLLPDYRSSFSQTIEQVFAGHTRSLLMQIGNLKGDIRWLESTSVPVRNDEGRIVALLSMARDITERKAADDRLKLAARVFGEAHEGILITDAEATIIDVNPTFCDITGYSRDEAIGKKPSLLKSGRQEPAFYREMWQTLLTKLHWQGEVWNRKKNGELYAELLSISALCDDRGQIIYFIGLFSDITQIKQQQQMLELMAHYDPLTRLPNRTLFSDRLLQAIARSKREKLLLAVCFLDLDGFKPVNDQLGHGAGDQVLIEVAKRIKQNLREEDTVSRHGGDEFALLLTGLHSVEEISQTLTRIHNAIAEAFLIDGQSVNIGASSGVSIFPLDDADADTLLRHADQAMYHAKLTGKNRFQLFDASQDQLVVDHHNQLQELETAFANHEFCLFYQPKISLKTGRITGVEALIRWQHPKKGLVSPLNFLPVLAATELEIKLGNWVMEQAWLQLNHWHRQGLKIEVSVNVSAYHLLWPGFIPYLEKLLAKHPRMASRHLQLEILESTALDDLAAVNRIVKTCHEALGIGAALDDFGTGYSSLTHLRHLPVDTVKIDRSFVRDMLDDPDDFAIVETVIGLSQAFGNQVVAEGVETEEQGLALLLLNCYVAQGYAIAKPMPADEMLGWIQHYRPFPIWETYANKEMSADQTQIALRRLDLRQWLRRVEQCLHGNRNNMACWPIMQPRKSHFGRWLRQARQQEQYNRVWLQQVTALHEQLLHKGDTLMQQFWQGEAQTARAGFAELEKLQQQLEDCLTENA
ncbi:EAL domain-containing protein [Methylomonas sp. SURF-2]|uniref:EAL domain-containing protein n=1 Tax=Methylomonas subterranea TaxID=2952225 RepID=A0ABT1TDB0_9GAMM|nr:EAL domain-containing protein [Methylomonas sp. SURF-2]MCQ8103431.1 EAL domain-containing protein [Methylomonas sp. SURF-2]